MQIGGVLTKQYAWRSEKSNPVVQIDLIIDRNDGVINLCEIKYCRDEYEIDASYARQLQRRVEVFRRETGTKSALHTTFITTYGLVRNEHAAQVQSEVVMADFFV